MTFSSRGWHLWFWWFIWTPDQHCGNPVVHDTGIFPQAHFVEHISTLQKLALFQDLNWVTIWWRWCCVPSGVCQRLLHSKK